MPLRMVDVYRRLTVPDQSIRNTSYWWHGKLERKAAEDVFAAVAKEPINIMNPGSCTPGTSVTLYELCCILMATKAVDAARALEIGTYDGRTALNLAANIRPDGEVVTIDLPPEGPTDFAIPVDSSSINITGRDLVGIQFQDHPYSDRIRQVFGDTAALDFSTVGGPFDLAFIDGCHTYEYVISDTEKVLSIMRDGGVVLWHDYAMMESVSRAVDDIHAQHGERFKEMCALEGTRIAVGWLDN